MTRHPLFAAAGGVLATAMVAVTLLAGAGAHAQRADRHVRIINETSHTITRFYASNVAATDWQEDILGDDVLKPGQDVNINIDDGTGHCKYDFKAVFDNGASLVKHNIDVCQITSYRYTD